MTPKRKYRKKFGHKRQYKNINEFIDVNDVLEELREENNRLLNELLFANECLISFCEFKIFIDCISNKFKYDLELNESQKFLELSRKVNQTIRRTNIDITTIKCELNEEFGEHEVRDTNRESLRSFRSHKQKRVNITNKTIFIKEINNNNNVFDDECEEVLNKKTKKRRLKESDDDYCPSDTSQHRFTDRDKKKKNKFKCHFDGCKKSCYSQLLLTKHEEGYQ